MFLTVTNVASGDHDFLIAPPALSAQSWAIADAGAGEVLFALRPDSQLPITSLSKIMTALLVLDLSDNLFEKAVVSDRADRTFGTSANVMVGERLTIGDLLYGLLLPSGNDAAVVLAEHYGRRSVK